MKRSFRLLTLPCCLTIIGGLLPLTSLSAQDAPAKPKAGQVKGKDVKPAAPAEEEDDDASATAEEIILANIAVLDNMDEAATLLETVKDVKSAKIASAKLKKLSAELKMLFGELHELGEPSDEEKTKLEAEKKLPKRAEKTAAHFQAATAALTKGEDKEPLQIISPALQEYGAIAKSAGKDEEAEEEEEAEEPAEADATPKAPATIAEATKLSNAILDNMEHAAEILEGITDEDTAKAAVPVLNQASASLKKIVKQAKGLGELSAEDKKKMEKNTKLAARGEKVGERFQKAATALTELDDKSAVVAISDALSAYGKVAQSLNAK